MFKFLRSTATVIAVALGATGVLLVLYAWRLPPFTTSVEVTDNAYIRGQITLISPQLAGTITEVAVQDFQEVKAGQLLVRLDDRIYMQKLSQAQAALAVQRAALANSEQQRRSGEARVASGEAQVDSAQAALRTAEASWRRMEPLLGRGVMTQSEADKRQSAFEQAQAALSQAQAAVEVARQDLAAIIVARQSLEAAVQGAEAAVHLAEIDLQNNRIVAPRDGRLGEVGARAGQYVSVGSQLMALVPDRIWVVANFKETQLAGMKVGQPIRFTVDALEHAGFSGHIERFSPAAGSEFSVLKPDNATGNFTKVAQRVPVRIAIDPGQELGDRLAPGMSVVISVDTASRSAAEPVASTGSLSSTALGSGSALILARDVDATVAWYRTHLGFMPISDRSTVRGRSVLLDRSGVLLEIGEEEGPSEGPEAGPAAVALTLLIDDVDREVQRLATEGVEILSDPRDAAGCFRASRIRDQDGHVIELRESLGRDADAWPSVEATRRASSQLLPMDRSDPTPLQLRSE
jgi:multidrug resistance efflux pump/catechol 2,3-dioxygenase-like lactoylglutathione lyase family enzyme